MHLQKYNIKLTNQTKVRRTDCLHRTQQKIVSKSLKLNKMEEGRERKKGDQRKTLYFKSNERIK